MERHFAPRRRLEQPTTIRARARIHSRTLSAATTSVQPISRGVHINSGIPNKAFYRVATDIGTEKAALIWYATLQRLWPYALFDDFAQVLAESARLLTKSGQVPIGTTQTVRSALREVDLYE
jgi:Zn-dependent metalloprotease